MPLPRALLRQPLATSHRHLSTTTAASPSNREGDISDAFASLSGRTLPPLPDSFRQLKCDLVRGRERAIEASWRRLLRELRRENEEIARRGPGVIPQVEYKDLERGVKGLREEIRKRGAVVVKGVIEEGEARAYKEEVEEYVRKNPWTRAFPSHDPQVYELYWSPPQVKARSHPSLLRTQRTLMTSLWHTSSPSPISLSTPISYADRLRIRQPGDASFALGPHMDGGSVERWEREGFGRGAVYDAVLRGEWEGHDPWDAGGRVHAVTNRYPGIGPCTAFRAWQGWMSMSDSGPGKGTLLVYPLVKLAAAYTLLRPLFRPRQAGSERAGFLEEGNWEMVREGDMTSELQGAVMGQGLEYTDEWHPHLELQRTMVHIPEVKAGDYVAWHCDTIHAVDKTHAGTSDSSVLYMAVCPLTEHNAHYLVRQRDAFLAGRPSPDFGGGEGEARHAGRPGMEDVARWGGEDGLAAMGLGPISVGEAMASEERAVVRRANEILGF
ncbi:hypothetical protein S40285_04696 [Stachybotrys chlorohalonatus IBT 40285]|uniref:DUF1479 domain protein n=1 Tax=Stachybotrys chlorohalonatus (strain IBT 40285) TaxID=1283841 RepID=A0A084R315_STAC4|nr:hypothetical protein S40285_04696 [Stachybotrys chlorohalonata IBT 40285]